MMTRSQREKNYEIFKSVNPEVPPQAWWEFSSVEALWFSFRTCLVSAFEGDEESALKLFLKHLAYTLDPANRVDPDLLTTVTSMSEQGISMSFQLADRAKVLRVRWLSSSPFGNEMLIHLEKCWAIDSMGFTVF